MQRKATIIEHKMYPVFLSSQENELSCYTVFIFPFCHGSRRTSYLCINGFTTSYKQIVFIMFISIAIPSLPLTYPPHHKIFLSALLG